MKLLIVDDSNLIRNRIARELSLKQVDSVHSAADGEQALKLALAIKPELITMDLTMPNMDGIACIPQILAALPKTNILVISALADKATAIQAVRLGARGFLCKPFTATDLNNALQQLIRKAKP